MANLFMILLLLSILGLCIGLAKPSFLKLKSRKQVSLIFGGGIVLFFILFGVTEPQDQPPVAISPVSVPTTNTPVTPQSVTPPTATTATSVPNTPEQNDAVFISSFKVQVAPDIKDAGTDLQSAGNDLQSYDFKSAINDMQNVQLDLQDAQIQMKDIRLGTMTTDMNQIRAIFNDAITSGLKGADIAITDLENANNDGVNTVAMPYFSTMSADILKGSQLMAGWEAKNPQPTQSQ